MTDPDRSAGLFRRRTPVILQQEHAECGLACLAMVAGFHGRPTGLAELRARRPAGDRGLSVDDLVTLADRIGLASRAVRPGKSGFAALRLPAILHWKTSHFVVLTRLGRRRARLHDPARGVVAMTRNELLAAASGVAIECVAARDLGGRQQQQSFSLLQFAGSVRHLWRYLGVLVALMATSQVLALAPAIVTQVLIDDIALAGDRLWIGRTLTGLLIVMLLAVALDAMRGWIGLYAGARFAVDSTSAVVGHLLKLPDSFVARRHLGDLLSRLESLGPLRQALTEWLVDSLVQVFVIAITLSAMLVYSPVLTLVSIAGLTAALLLIAAVTPPMRRLNEEALVQRAAERTSLLETLRRFETVRGLGLGDQRRRQWQGHFIAGLGRQARQSGIGLARTAASGMINAVEQVVFLYIGLRGVLDNDITLGVLFAFMGFRARLGAAASNLYAKVQRYALVPVHTRRLSDIVLASATPSSAPGALRRRVRGEIAAHGLCFSYDRDSPLIDRFACRIAAGSHVAITGPSGCGKTTLLRLLAGFDTPVAGTVMLDGIELSLWCREHLAEQTAFVFQGDGLFRGTIGENIAAFSPYQDVARIRGAATLAEVWSDVVALPMGLDTMLSDTSVALSGGQVQRLTLARALYRQPRVLFLDEATSHLDVVTERRVWQNLRRLGVTVVSVAHRPEAIRQADDVIALP